jgi:hypothetical protein
MGRFRAVRRKLQAQSLDLRPWAIHPQAIWWSADSGVTRADATVDALSTWTPANLVDWAGSAPELIETADTGEHSISDTGTSSLVIGPTKLSVELEAVNRDWAWLKLGTGTLIAHFDLANGTVGTVGAGATASIEAGSEAGRWLCTVYGVTAATNMAVGASPADGVTSYEGSVGLSAIKARSPVLTQHRASGWTSQVYGGAAGPAMAQATPASQLFVQADATSPGGLSLFGKPCLWNPTANTSQFASSSGATLNLINTGNYSVVALVNCISSTNSYITRALGGTESRSAIGVSYGSGGGGGAAISDGAIKASQDIELGQSFVCWEFNASAGTCATIVDGNKVTDTYSNVPGASSYITTVIGKAVRELVISPVLTFGQRAAMRAGMLQRMAA